MRAEEHEADEAPALDEWAGDYEVHIHQEREAYIRRLCIEGSRAYLGRSAVCSFRRTEESASDSDRAAEVSSERSSLPESR